MHPESIMRTAMSLLLVALLSSTVAADERLKVLFLGDRGHHRPIDRAADIVAPLAKAGIDMAYTEDLSDLNSANLNRYDALIIYANHTRITPEQEKALLDYVESGKGFVPLHCASYCFLNSPKYISLVGAQFQRHDAISEFQPKIIDSKHEAMKGVEEFSAFDEPYVHHRLGDDIKLLMVRETRGGQKEPWTWVRKQGKGRVFYTASGHDERVWRHTGFQKLVIQGIRWACGKPDHQYELPEFKRVPAELPNYRAGTGKLINDMQVPLSPADSMKCISVPGGFKVELFASEPDIVKPICIAWDDRGRAFVAETVDYPNNLQAEGKGHDRILICEATKGGKADKFTVFADKLSIPTGMVYVPGHGLIVSQAPHMLLLKDTDGDDKADVRKVLFSGFGTGDTHAGPSNLRLGFDGWIYATCGYSGFRGTVGGKLHQFGQGLFRFKPDGSALEFLGSSSNNTWGLGMDEAGEIVYSTANGEHSSHLAIPNRYFESVRGWLGKGTEVMADHRRIHPLTAIRQVDHFGGFTAAAGHAVYTARQFPSSYWNRIAFVAEPTGHLVHMVRLERDRSSLVTTDRFNLFASLDEWCAPIMAEVGPDGAVWVLDWYNIVVQHNPTPPGFRTGKGNAYETPLRDKKHGRIYRIVNTAAPLSKTYDLKKEPVEGIKSDNQFWRMQAQWTLAAQNKKEMAADLIKIIQKHLGDATGESPQVVHALYALAKGPSDKPTGAILDAAFDHYAPGVRRAVLRVYERDDEGATNIRQRHLLYDRDLVVRRDAFLALSEMPPRKENGSSIEEAMRFSASEKERWLESAAIIAAARHSDGFMLAALNGKGEPVIVRAMRIVAEHHARGGNAESLPSLLRALEKAPASMAGAFLSGLAAGWPASKTPELDAATRKALVAVLPKLEDSGKLALLSLGRRWGLEKDLAQATVALRAGLREKVVSDKTDVRQRVESARELVQLGLDAETLDALLDLLGFRAGPALVSGLLDALGQSSLPEVGPALIARWEKLTPGARSQAIEVLMRRPIWTTNLLDALEKNTINPGDLNATQAQNLGSHPDRKLAERAKTILEKGGRLANADRQKVLDQLLHVTKKTGNAERGREVFKKTCAKCHKHGDIGEKIGPELTGFAVHPKDKILTEIIDPNRSVEGNYRLYTVTTDAGRIYNGLLASESATAIELVDVEAKRHTILRQDIESMVATNKSLMPDGLEKEVKEEEFVDLLEFLTARGKFFSLPLEKVATVVTTKGMFYRTEDNLERLVFPDWTPKTAFGVPFVLVDPKVDRVKNAIMLYSPNGPFAPNMPKSIKLPCNAPAKSIHFLSGVSGWGFPLGTKGNVSMIVRLHYADGKTEDHPLKNGEHFADYIRRVDVPGSQFAFMLRGQQIRYLSVTPGRQQVIKEIELVKGPDATAPVVMAVTVEQP
jgi:putative membrane-bound dehydrogenase-like protein